jgi:bacterioferritin-associated ferredoxin
MTRCECAGLTFEQIARVAVREGITAFELLCRRTGCAATCTACRCDLEAFLARRGALEPAVVER